MIRLLLAVLFVLGLTSVFLGLPLDWNDWWVGGPGNPSKPTATSEPPVSGPMTPTYVAPPASAIPGPEMTPQPPTGPERTPEPPGPTLFCNLSLPPAYLDGQQVPTSNVLCNEEIVFKRTNTVPEIPEGKNYVLNIPAGYSVLVVGVTTEIHREGGTAKQYLQFPAVVITGPYQGGVGIYDGAIRVFPTEWTTSVVNNVLPIHRAQAGRQDIQAVEFDG